MSLFKKPSNRRLKIYVVDDEEYYLKLIEASLRKLGHDDIKTFKTGEECLLEVIKERPDCVILDYIIKSGQNGDDILSKVKLHDKSIDVIILSGQEDVDIATNSIRIGATDYVVKNSMSFFNIGNTLGKINNIASSKDLLKWKDRRIRGLFILLIIIVWVFGGILTYIRIKNGMLF